MRKWNLVFPKRIFQVSIFKSRPKSDPSLRPSLDRAVKNLHCHRKVQADLTGFVLMARAVASLPSQMKHGFWFCRSDLRKRLLKGPQVALNDLNMR